MVEIKEERKVADGEDLVLTFTPGFGGEFWRIPGWEDFRTAYLDVWLPSVFGLQGSPQSSHLEAPFPSQCLPVSTLD